MASVRSSTIVSGIMNVFHIGYYHQNKKVLSTTLCSQKSTGTQKAIILSLCWSMEIGPWCYSETRDLYLVKPLEISCQSAYFSLFVCCMMYILYNSLLLEHLWCVIFLIISHLASHKCLWCIVSFVLNMLPWLWFLVALVHL